MGVKEQISELYDEDFLFLPEEYDCALLGVCNMFDKSVAAYNMNKVKQVLREDHGMSREEAEEFFSYNIIGSYVGEKTPVYIDFYTNLNGNKRKGKSILPIFHEEEKSEHTGRNISENNAGNV